MMDHKGNISAQQYNSSELDDEEYEPTEQEIIGYAEFLGMDLDEDKDLLYIAEEGVSIFDSLKPCLVESSGSRTLEGLFKRE
jgi:hypothetical protein